MKLGKRKPSGREKDKAAINLLDKLREQLYSSNVSLVRQSAFNLSWLQEDGLEILKEALIGQGNSKRTKGAAAYGLRKMRGRMKKIAMDVLLDASQSSDSATSEISKNAILVSKEKGAPKSAIKKKKQAGKFSIKEIPHKGKRHRPKHKVHRPSNRYHR